MQFVDAAGKDAPPRRARLRTIAMWGMEFYREQMREAVNSNEEPTRAEHSIAMAERCLGVAKQVDSNANLTSVAEAWIDDLAR